MDLLIRILKAFWQGATHKTVLQMTAIFILAGAFAGIAGQIGAVDATVAATLRLLPAKMLYAGLFLTSCIISFSVGTSVGTIVAVTPIAAGIAADTGVGLPFMVGIVVGGAFFGDNLSFISDTTLAATKALRVEMKDKFKANILTVLPAVILCLAIYLIAGFKADMIIPELSQPQLSRLIPYILVIVLALCGVNVLKILGIGIIACVIVGLVYPGDAAHTVARISGDMAMGAWHGVLGMTQVIIVALVAGGALNVIKEVGWFDAFVNALLKVVNGQRGAMAVIAAMVSVVNMMTANNTVAILTVGGVAYDIASKFKLDPRQTAGILDMFSCLTQSLLPYGAQLLMASALAGISAVGIIPWLFYPMLMGICAIISILRLPKA